MSIMQMFMAGARLQATAVLNPDLYDRITTTSSFVVNTDGGFYATDSAPLALLYQWLTSGVASSCEVRVDPLSGSFSTGATGTWLALSSSRTWTLNWPGGALPVVATAAVSIRDAATLVVLASATISLSTSP